eukprot:215923-Chlamydomonas_euryale.AAC.3
MAAEVRFTTTVAEQRPGCQSQFGATAQVAIHGHSREGRAMLWGLPLRVFAHQACKLYGASTTG